MDQSLILLCLKKFRVVTIFFKGKQIIKFLKFIYNLGQGGLMTTPLDSSSNWCPESFGMYCRWFSLWIVWCLYSLTLVLEGCTLTKVYSWEPWFSGTRFLPTNLNSHVKGTNPENLHVFNFKLSITPYKGKWWKIMEGG